MFSHTDFRRLTRRLIASTALAVVTATPALGQVDPTVFGTQVRASSATDLIVLAVQQGISTLPPTAGQSFSYEYDSTLQVFVPRQRLGPTSILSASTAGKGAIAARVSGGYFSIEDSYSTIYNYPRGFLDGETEADFTRTGIAPEADVGLVNVSLAYGLLKDLDLSLNVPIVLVDAKATPLDGCIADFVDDPCLDIEEASETVIRDDFDAAFNEGDHVGIGRISLGAKHSLYSSDGFQFATAVDVFFPSPNEKEFSGTETFAIFPRIAAEMPLGDLARGQLSLGYDYDVDRAELRRFVWNVGAVTEVVGTTVDLGFGGSEFDEEINFNPDVLSPNFGPGFNTGDNQIDSSYVDFLFGLKRALTERMVLAGAVNVPVFGDGLRPDVFFSVAIEYWIAPPSGA